MSLSLPTRRRFLAATGGFCVSAAIPGIAYGQGAAIGVPFGPDLGGEGWEHMTFRRIPATEYAASGRSELAITARASSSLIHRPLPEPAFDAQRASWRWRVDEGVPATDLSRRGGDDRAIAIYFAFAPQSARASAAVGRTSLRRLLISGSGNLLVYVWGGGEPRGTIVANPYTRGRGVYLIQRPADTPTGQWQSEIVDLAGDYRRAFGDAPGILVGLAIASDSDDVDGVNRARVADLALAG
ncbi:MAG: DUF3047 domain-containing protein [Salinarimonas sp.]|nr:DUF3047 domain-containing protein [Salinarimonas sp.]